MRREQCDISDAAVRLQIERIQSQVHKWKIRKGKDPKGVVGSHVIEWDRPEHCGHREPAERLLQQKEALPQDVDPKAEVSGELTGDAIRTNKIEQLFKSGGFHNFYYV